MIISIIARDVNDADNHQQDGLKIIGSVRVTRPARIGHRDHSSFVEEQQHKSSAKKCGGGFEQTRVGGYLI